MTDKKLTDLPAAGALTGAELYYAVQSGLDVKVLGSNLVPSPPPTPPGGSNLQIQYNNSGAFGGLTDIQVTARIIAFTALLSGAVPPPGTVAGKVLSDSGAWITLGGGGGGPAVLAGDMTLNASSTTTVVSTTCTAGSRIYWAPKTAHAASQMATLFLSSIGTNTFTLTHGSNSNVDQTFAFLVIG